jgi:hypothetical protein
MLNMSLSAIRPDCPVYRLLAIALTLALGAGLLPPASATILASHPVVVAVRRGDCDAAVKLLKPEVTLNDDQSAFVTGRMLDEGICVQQSPTSAAHFFARATELGDKSAELDYGAKVGLGNGVAQDYARAGDLCRDAGLDPEAHVSRYSLGYACTISGVAAKLLRETLPKGAFYGTNPVVLIEFSPGSAQMHIRATPRVGMADAATGSNMRMPLVNATLEIEKAWRNAVAAVPKPDAAQLENQPVKLTLDVDMTLEGGRAITSNNAKPFRSVLPGDVMPGGERLGGGK